jgi:hypothetical protein
MRSKWVAAAVNGVLQYAVCRQIENMSSMPLSPLNYIYGSTCMWLVVEYDRTKFVGYKLCLNETCFRI